MNNIDTTRSGFFPNAKTTKETNSKVADVVLRKNTPERANELKAFAKTDSKVDISDAIKDFSKIKRAVDAAPEIDNTDKIASLKSRIQAGTYNVDYDALADRILSEEM